MGLFSKKKQAHSIEEALFNEDEDYTYTTAKGHTYKNILSYGYSIRKDNAFDDLDDMLEMFAPNIMNLLISTNKNVQALVQKNKVLQMKCQQFESEIEALKEQVNKGPYSRT